MFVNNKEFQLSNTFTQIYKIMLHFSKSFLKKALQPSHSKEKKFTVIFITIEM